MQKFRLYGVRQEAWPQEMSHWREEILSHLQKSVISSSKHRYQNCWCNITLLPRRCELVFYGKRLVNFAHY